MALYLGGKKVKMMLNGKSYHPKFYTTTLILNGAMLLSADNYTLKDKNGLILTAQLTDTLSTVKEDI